MPSRASARARGPAPRTSSGARYVRVGKEQLLAVDLVTGDRSLAFRRDQPIDELLTQIGLHARMLGRVDQHHPVLIEQALVALDGDHEVGFVLERNPRAAV